MKIIDIKGDSDLNVVWLHGFGANAWDLVDLAEYCDPDGFYNHYFPNGTLDLYGQGERGARAWFPLEDRVLAQIGPGGGIQLSAAPRDRLLMALSDVDSILAHIDVKPEKLILGGFSQGAILSLHWMLEKKVKLPGLVLLSGAPLDLPYLEKNLPEHSGQRVFQSHGTQDPILAYSEAEKLQSLLKKSGLSGRWVPFRGGHTVSEEVISALEKTFKDWRKI